MELLRKRRDSIGVSQRTLARLSALSYKTVQLIEGGAHDPKVSTLRNLARSLGYPPNIIDRRLSSIFGQPAESIAIVSERMLAQKGDSWKVWLFEFVDAFRKGKDLSYVDMEPVRGLPVRIEALIASTVETLCDELRLETPHWCAAVAPLKDPWFVSGMESLKALAIVESPIHFRKRNIFVLGNFLSRR